MPLITLMKAHAAWGDLPLLDDADLSIDSGERVGLIGRNGTGKSTLLSILAGHTHLDDGELRVQDGLRILYVEQEPVLPQAVNIKESLIARGKLDKIDDEREHWRRLAKLDECLMKFDLDPEHSVDRVSGGERKRAALALAFALEPDLLLLDEPTNHLDITAITTLENLVNTEFRTQRSLVVITYTSAPRSNLPPVRFPRLLPILRLKVYAGMNLSDLIRLINANPSILGIMISVIIKSGVCWSIKAKASSALNASRTAYSDDKVSLISQTISRLSSTTKITGLPIFPVVSAATAETHWLCNRNLFIGLFV